MDFKVEFLQQVTILGETIDNFLADAFEGGINHWCDRVEILRNPDGTVAGVKPELQDEIEYASDVISRGGILTLFNDEEKEQYVLDLARMIKGITLYCQKHNKSYHQLQDDYDAEDVDCIVQYAVFDEVVYG